MEEEADADLMDTVNVQQGVLLEAGPLDMPIERWLGSGGSIAECCFMACTG